MESLQPLPQSNAQLDWVSSGASHVPSPQNASWQSAAQSAALSPASQVPLPHQQSATQLVVVSLA